MLLWLLNWLERFGYKVPQFLEHYSSRMILACATAFVIWLVLGPSFIKKLYEWKVGQKIRMEECPLLGQLHEKKKDTPTMGGALILLAMSISSLLWMDLGHLYSWLLMFGTLSLGALGAYDDFLKLKWKNTKGLSARKKMLCQVIVGLLVSFCVLTPNLNQWLPVSFPKAYELSDTKSSSLQSGSAQQKAIPQALSTNEFHHLIYIPGIKTPFQLPQSLVTSSLLALFFCFVITGSSNSVNLTDGLDGLAAGTISLSAMCLMIVAFISNHTQMSDYLNWAYIEGSGEVAIFMAALIGACVGFLWFNCFPAQVFMGDTGSLGLGGALGIAAILLRREFFFAIASGVFVIEALSVILQVWSMRKYKKRLFLCSPIHHHFEYKGWAETKVVVRFWILGLLFALTALITIKLQ